MEVSFQNDFKQWETWKGVDIVPDYAEGEFLFFKITDATRQIKVKIHKRHFAMFVDSMGQTKVNFVSSNVLVSGQVSCNTCKFLPQQYDDYCSGCIKFARYELQETLR